MIFTDPIADLLTRIRNSITRGHETTSVPHSKMKEAVLKILEADGFIHGYEIEEEDGRKNIIIELKYVNGQPMIHELKRVSKPGIRRYVSSKEIPNVKRGLGIAVLTTSQGVMSSKEARQKNIGGELICTIW